MISVSQMFTDSLKGSIYDIPAEIHGNLSGHYDLGTSLVAAQISYRYMIMFRHNRYDIFGRNDLMLIRRNDILKSLFGEFKSDFFFSPVWSLPLLY